MKRKPEMITLVNSEGRTMEVRGNTTLPQLLRMGMKDFKLLPKNKPIPKGYWASTMKKPKPVTPKPLPPIWTILKDDTKEVKAMLKESKRLFEMSGNFIKDGLMHKAQTPAELGMSLVAAAAWLRCYVNGEFKKKR